MYMCESLVEILNLIRTLQTTVQALTYDILDTFIPMCGLVCMVVLKANQGNRIRLCPGHLHFIDYMGLDCV